MWNNPNVQCPECNTWNKPTNWQCWNCKKEGRVTELEKVGGANAPWADTKTVYGGKLKSSAGTSTYWNYKRNSFDTNTLISPKVGLLVAENIFKPNPDSVELNTGANTMDYDMPNEPHFNEPQPLDEFSMNGTGFSDQTIPYRRNAQSPVWGDPLFRNRLRRNAQSPVWGGPLFRNRLRRNAQTPVWGGPLYRRNAQKPVWGGPLYRRHRYRRNAQKPVWGGPLYRRNAQSPVWGGPLYRRNAQTPVWGGPLYRRQLRRNPQKPVWGGPLYRRNAQKPVWGGPLYRRNAQKPVWGDPLYRMNPTCLGCDDETCECMITSHRRNPVCIECDCDPCQCTTAWNRNPCASCNKETCNCGCEGDETLCICTDDTDTLATNPNDDLYAVGPDVLYGKRNLRRNSRPAWGGPLFKKRFYRHNS